MQNVKGSASQACVGNCAVLLGVELCIYGVLRKRHMRVGLRVLAVGCLHIPVGRMICACVSAS